MNENKKQAENKNQNDRSTWAIGGTTLIGLGVGFVFLALYGSTHLFVASLLIGVGLGILITSLLSRGQG